MAHVKCTCLSCAKLSLCVSSAGSSQRSKDAVSLEFAVRFGEWHTAKTSFAVCLSFAVCCFGLHTANTTFAGCPRFSPRQISGHTVNARFPVVSLPACAESRRIRQPIKRLFSHAEVQPTKRAHRGAWPRIVEELSAAGLATVQVADRSSCHIHLLGSPLWRS